MKSIFCAKTFLLTFLAICVATPLAAQEREDSTATKEVSEEPQSDGPQTLLPKDLTPDQLIQFFTLMSDDDSLQETLAPLLEASMQAGEPIDNWTSLGVDLLADLDAREGGARAWYLQGTDQEVLSVLDLSGEAAPDLSNFQSYALRPEPVGLVAERVFLSFLPGIWFEIAAQRTQRGNALCYSGYFGVNLHTRRPYQEWTEDELIWAGTLFSLVDQMSSFNLCLIYERTNDGRYLTRGFTHDGRSLPVLDAEATPVLIMPASDLDAFLTRNPKTGDEEQEPSP